MSKTDYRAMYGREWLGHWDLQDKDVVVTITAVTQGELTAQGNRKSKKPALSLKGTDKKIAVNATNGKALKSMYGPYVEDWIGKRITLYKTTTEMAGETVECIRVRPVVPAPRSAKDDADGSNVTPLPGQAA
jgi:hypothetical protein